MDLHVNWRGVSEREREHLNLAGLQEASVQLGHGQGRHVERGRRGKPAAARTGGATASAAAALCPLAAA